MVFITHTIEMFFEITAMVMIMLLDQSLYSYKMLFLIDLKMFVSKASESNFLFCIHFFIVFFNKTLLNIVSSNVLQLYLACRQYQYSHNATSKCN